MARILVIDDDALIRETLKTMLQLERHEVALAPHGEEGVRHFREQAVDLVICDTFMPRHGRMETIAAVRSVPTIGIVARIFTCRSARPRRLQSRSGRSSCLD